MKISFWFEFAKQFLQEQILSFLNCFFCASEEDLFFFFLLELGQILPLVGGNVLFLIH